MKRIVAFYLRFYTAGLLIVTTATQHGSTIHFISPPSSAIRRGGDADVVESSSTDDGVPVFVVEPPEFNYIVKNRPLTITCVAVPAIQINFKCYNQWISPKSHTTMDQVDPTTGRHRLQASIDIDKDEVDELVGSGTASAGGSVASSGSSASSGGGQQLKEGYWCECHAWNSRPEQSHPVTAKSRRAYFQGAC